MGPYSEEKQFDRAMAISNLLENPDLPTETRAMWQNHLANIARNETTYNWRVKEIYSHMKVNPLVEWNA
jgi:hypothetical protein